jgi:hypothetical protein
VNDRLSISSERLLYKSSFDALRKRRFVVTCRILRNSVTAFATFGFAATLMSAVSFAADKGGRLNGIESDGRSGAHGNTMKIKMHPIPYVVLMDDQDPLKSMQDLKRKTR